MDALAGANDWAEVINIGQSYEGRDMNVLAITKVLFLFGNNILLANIHKSHVCLLINAIEIYGPYNLIFSGKLLLGKFRF